MDEQTTLVDAMHRSVDGHHLDLDRLVDVATSRGTRLRRRRRAAITLAASGLSAAAVVTAIALGGVAPGGRQAPAAGPGTVTDTDRTITGDEAREYVEKRHEQGTEGDVPVPGAGSHPLSARALAAALLERVQATGPGTATGFEGQDGLPNSVSRTLVTNAYASLQWAPEGSGAPGQVGINVQESFTEKPRFWACAARQAVTCTRTEFADGTVLLEYEYRVTEARGVRIDRTADTLRADGLRVVVFTSNAERLERGAPVRNEPPLTVAELREVATWSDWATALPAKYTEAGAAIEEFSDLSDFYLGPVTDVYETLKERPARGTKLIRPPESPDRPGSGSAPVD